MFIDTNKWRGGYTRNGEQRAEGAFLVVMCHETERDPSGHRKLRAFVRNIRMKQCGHWMIGTIRASVFGHKIAISLSGTYGSDGLPHDTGFKNHADKSIPYESRPIVDLWDVSHVVPQELADKFWAGGGHNSAGSEGPSMRKWAFNNQSILRRWNKPVTS